jgi:hypothetical protein
MTIVGSRWYSTTTRDLCQERVARVQDRIGKRAFHVKLRCRGVIHYYTTPHQGHVYHYYTDDCLMWIFRL